MAQVRKKLAPPLVGSDILLVVRPKQNINQVLDVTYDELISALKTVFPTTSGGVSSVNGQTGVVILALDDLSDVNAGSPTSGQVLQWNGTEWVASTIGTAAWGSIGTGTGVASQTDLVSYLTSNYVPIARNLTINGVTYDLSADRSWTIAAGVTSVGATAPITSSGGSTPTISTSMNTNKLIGRGTAGVGVMEEITLGTNLSLSGTTLNATVSGVILKGTASGTDTYTTTISGVTSYNDGDAYLIRFTNGNTTGCTLNINSLGAITLYRNNDGALIGGDIVSGAEMICVYNSTLVAFQTIGTAPNTLLAYVTNADSVTITKGQAVYAFGGTGDRMTVKLANNVADATSAQTVGLVLSTSIAANQKGFIMMQGLLDGLSILPTSTYNDGDPVYLGSTPGAITKTKPYAPNHLVYLGVVTTASPGNAGRMYVKVQNGYELDELHNVQAQSPTYKDTLWYDNTVSPAQWKTASIATILGYTPGSVTSVSASVPAPASPALSVNVSNPTTTPAIAITANGTTSQYVRGDGSLATFPTSIPVIYKSTADGTGITGVSSEQISASQLIPANTFTVGDIIRINWRVAKTGTASTISVKLYVNTTSSLVGAIQVAQNLPGFANSVSNGYIRMLAIKSATNTQSITPASVFDEYLTASQIGTSNINWTVNQYIIFMTQLNTATADVVRTNYYLIEKL